MILDQLTGKILGKLEKMLILAYDNSEDVSSAAGKVVGKYTVLINPESYTVDYKTQFVCGDQPPGASGKDEKYYRTLPVELRFKFLFDNTGLIDLKPRISIADGIKEFKDVLFKYEGELHRPRYLKIVWGDGLIYSCVATGLEIEYKLFNSGGMPIRAIATTTFRESIGDKKRAAQEKKSSPDLTHIIQVKAGDTLPLLCKKVYGDPKYYYQVAAANELGNFRRLQPGMELVFPPIDKTAN